jgi:hypothetical protein
VLINIAMLPMQALKKLDIKKEDLSLILEGLRGRADPDLKSIAVSFSNAIFRRPARIISCMFYFYNTCSNPSPKICLTMYAEKRATRSRKLCLPPIVPSSCEFFPSKLEFSVMQLCLKCNSPTFSNRLIAISN